MIKGPTINDLVSTPYILSKDQPDEQRIRHPAYDQAEAHGMSKSFHRRNTCLTILNKPSHGVLP